MTPGELLDWRFPSGVGVQVCALRERAAVLARRLGLTLQTWDQDGLGPTSGVLLPISGASGLWVREFGVDHPQFPGPLVEFDAREAAIRGFDAIMSDVASALRLELDAVSWRPPDAAAWRSDARRLLELAQARRG